MLLRKIWTLLILTYMSMADATPFVIGQLDCQLGNNLFQVAATCAVAWDNGAEPHFPDLKRKTENNLPTNFAKVFFRLNAEMPQEPISRHWRLPFSSNFCYMPIPYQPNIEIAGTFHSEKYFAHHRERLLELFTPLPEVLDYISTEYKEIAEHPLSVGVQIRWFGCANDANFWIYLAQYGYDYFDKAMSLFPPDTLFVVSSNNLEFAKKNLPSKKNMIFLENEPYYVDFFLLSMCKHQIISNSTFGWWAAWLNRNPDKKIVVPKNWIDPIWENETPVCDVWPNEWIQIDAKWGKPNDHFDSFR